MNVIFYKNTSEKNVINKSIEKIIELDCKIKNANTISNITLIIHLNEYPTFNYCYIEKFHRYYFITDIGIFPNNLYSISLKTDVLTTVKDSIKIDNNTVLKFKNSFNTDGVNILLGVNNL